MSAVIDRSVSAANVVVGKILHRESGAGIPDLLVDLFDLDAWSDPENADGGTLARASGATATATATAPPAIDIPALYKLGDRIGSVITDSAGNFRFNVQKRDFNSGRANEAKPDLLLVVLAPAEPGLDLAKRVLYFSQDVRFNAGSQEAYVIRFNSAFLKEHDIPFGVAREKNRDTPIDRVSAYVSERTREREFNAGVAEWHRIEIAQETTARSAFRKDFLKQVATDLHNVTMAGVVVQEGEKIDEKNAETISQGVAKANALLGGAQAGGVPVNLYLTPEDRQRLAGYLGGGGDFVDIPDSDMGDILFRRNSSDNPGTLLVNHNPIASFCTVESAEQKCAREHAGVGHAHAEPEPPAGGGGSSDVITAQDIPEFIGRMVRHMPSPDSVLQPELSQKRATRADLEQSVAGFALPRGPAEVPAFYDFNTLQIAFNHVWKQLFDENIPNLAYTANSIGKSKYGVDNLVNTAFHNGFSLIATSFVVTPVEVPPVIARFFDVTKEEYNEMTVPIRESLLELANRVESAGLGIQTGNENFSSAPTVTVGQLRARQLVIEQGERLIDSVRHDNYYTLHRTLRDLHDRLSGTYEFTVFAADKDYHSVNFGLMTTYRQQWTPLTYQPGKLVRTVPLTPGETRQYGVKNNRTEKRASKEAKKNNSSITNEQNTTSRVEAEIMAKAQTKTNFGITAEGDYDIVLASGKSTTTFGVEALQESAQNRKDFREAVLKAVQEYKDENSTEVTTEFTDASEITESGTIKNPNDELSVTYLFYELQKRFRLNEQIYRVMPVVLVAQEVPAPNKITESWVIAHDWILNRHLLDDSFRPTLQYLAKKSVGDDFALRELRKNLRQQRNLVETLRIEFSAASVEADNRYKALENAIQERIDEEHAENTDGFFSDVGDFFGGDGQDPEAAKARELAAKDAHQYALEKAEKSAVALRQEVNTLHTLTEAYNKTLQARLDAETQVKRLLVHIRDNIFYYMQAVWSLEPPDQRFLRLHKVRVPVIELESRSYRVNLATEPDIFAPFREPGTEKHKAFLRGKLKHNDSGGFDTRSLAEVAQLDNLLGFKGNYMVFPLKEHNALTEFMAAPYIDRAFGAMDPDELANVSLEDFSRYVCCLHEKLSETEFTALKPYLKEWLEKLMASPLRSGDEIVVPTGTLFIEALVDPNAVLEDFKLRHRELDVFSADQDVRRKALENLRLAARLLNEERGDPDVEKHILVQGNGVGTVIDVDNP